MRLINLLLLISILTITDLQAQIPNGYFDTWITGSNGRLQPAGWLCSDSVYTAATVSQDAGYSSPYSAKFTCVYDAGLGYYAGGELKVNHLPWTGALRPNSMNGFWTVNNPGHGDLFTLEVWFYDATNAQIGHGAIDSPIGSSIPNWTAFSVPVSYTNANAIASFSIDIVLNNFTSNPNQSANLDNLEFDINSSVPETSVFDSDFIVVESQNQKNNFQLKYHGTTSEFNVSILDMTGKSVITRANKFNRSEAIDLDLSALTPGIYICAVSNDQYRKAIRLIVH